MEPASGLAAAPAAQLIELLRVQLHSHHRFVRMQVGHTESLPERKTRFILLHLSGALCTLMIGRTTIMAESAPLSFLSEPRTSAKNLFFAA
jgi:hypothetical protein